MVMMNMIRSTSMTSMNGVVLISIIGSPFLPVEACIELII